MSGEMGTFRVDVEIENPAHPGPRRVVKSVLVDTGAEFSWVPAEILEDLGVERYNRWRFRQAAGTILNGGAERRSFTWPEGEPLTKWSSENRET